MEKAEAQRLLSVLAKFPGAQGAQIVLESAARSGPNPTACLMYLLTEAAATKRGMMWLVEPVIAAAAAGKHGLQLSSLLGAAFQNRAAHYNAAGDTAGSTAGAEAMEQYNSAKLVVYALTVGWLHTLACDPETSDADAAAFLRTWQGALQENRAVLLSFEQFAAVHGYMGVVSTTDVSAEAEARLARWCRVADSDRKRVV